MKHVRFEACVDSVESAMAAARGGAHRLELCCALSEGGLTPTAGFVAAVHEALPDIPLCALLRPRSGSFAYSDADLRVACLDAECLARAGAERLAIGCLTTTGAVDEPALSLLARRCDSLGLKVTFNRAVDAAADYDAAIAAVLRCPSVDAMLTSGGASCALDGAAVIRRAVARCVEPASVHIIAAGGVGPENAAALVAATGVDWLHGTASVRVRSTVSRGGAGLAGGGGVDVPAFCCCAEEEGVRRVTDALRVAATIAGDAAWSSK